MFGKESVWQLNHVKGLILQTSGAIEACQNLLGLTRNRLEETWQTANRCSEVVWKTCFDITHGIRYDENLCKGLTNLQLFTAGAPGFSSRDFQLLRVDPFEVADWSFSLLGYLLVEIFSKATKKALLARVSSNNRQHWVWQDSEGLFKYLSEHMNSSQSSMTESDGSGS